MLTGVGGGGHDHDRQPDGRGENPVADVDDLGVAGRPEVQRFDRVAHGDVAVDAHGGEREDGREHVVVVDGHHHLAQNVPKRPRPHQVVDALERQRAGDQGVGQSQIEDVDVRGCLHFSVSAQKEWIYTETMRNLIEYSWQKEGEAHGERKEQIQWDWNVYFILRFKSWMKSESLLWFPIL